MSAHLDDLGHRVLVPPQVRRVVSLVPSLTESVAVSTPGVLSGATHWCTHPPGLDVVRIGGTKNPDVGRIIGLAPDLVLANEEENREPDLEALRAAGLAVWTTRVRSLPEAFGSLERLLTQACRLPSPPWLAAARVAWRSIAAPTARDQDPGWRAVVPIWRRPWMVVGSDTFAGDLLYRLGVSNVYQSHPQRYPRIGLQDLLRSGADLAVLPDEPYRFTAADGPEAFPGMSVALVSGRHLTWYGPSLTEAPAVLTKQLASVIRGGPSIAG